MTTATKKSAPRRSTSTRVRPFNRDGALTVKQWDALPDTKPRYELLDGKLVQKMTTKFKHSQAAGALLVPLVIWARESGWRFFPEGTGVTISEYKAYVPDVIGFRPSAVLDPEVSTGGAPFLVAEVLSRSTARRDRVDKLRDYAQIGVAIYLIIDPDKRTISVFTLHRGAYAEPRVLAANDIWQPDELPGLRLELATLWMPQSEVTS